MGKSNLVDGQWVGRSGGCVNDHRRRGLRNRNAAKSRHAVRLGCWCWMCRGRGLSFELSEPGGELARLPLKAVDGGGEGV